MKATTRQERRDLTKLASTIARMVRRRAKVAARRSGMLLLLLLLLMAGRGPCRGVWWFGG
jgi:hypothetical protein